MHTDRHIHPYVYPTLTHARVRAHALHAVYVISVCVRACARVLHVQVHMLTAPSAAVVGPRTRVYRRCDVDAHGCQHAVGCQN